MLPQIQKLFAGLIELSIPLLIANLLVVCVFLFFQNNKKKTDLFYQQHIAKLEARALRARMNPHFIFNALNNLQSILILKGEREANHYIGLLSTLLRFTLEMSSKENILLSEEIDYLEAYLHLQKMRLEHKLNYKIEMETNLKMNTNAFSIPPMLIQPLVENAIIHGISPLKKRTGKVWLTLVKSEDYLNVAIEDNGIGLKASKKLKKNKERIYRSYGTQILRERIDIFNYLKNKNIKFILKQKVKDDKIIGTLAQINIPLLQTL